MNKRIYSLNLAAYIAARTNLLAEVVEDTNTHSYYFVFPECAAVKAEILNYKKNNPSIEIHDFLREIKKIRETIAAKKGGGQSGV